MSSLKKNILYLLLLALFIGFLIIMELPNGSDSPNILKTYTLGYLAILSGPFSVWFLFPTQEIVIQIIATIIGVSIISLWFYMVKKTYAFWKIFIILSIWVLLGGLTLFGEISSHC